MSESILITGSAVLDGTGAPATAADVLVQDGRIRAVEQPGRIPPDNHRVLEAAGLTLTPGFIDVHSHADNAPFLNEDDTSKIMQGVTTEVVGNCGFSLAPRREETGPDLEALATRIFPPLPWTWSSYGEFLAATDACGYVTNYAPLVGHHALRVAVLGMADAAPSASQLSVMGDHLDEAIGAGAFGLSSGLIYPPGLFSETAELVALVRRLPERRPYVTHMRGEGSQLLKSIGEAIEIGRRAERRLHISHLKAASRRVWGRMPEVIDQLGVAREQGLDVRQDVYPYTAGSTMLTAALPPWFQEGGGASVLGRLHDPDDLSRLRDELGRDDGSWENFIYGAGWDGIVVAASASHRYDGLSLAQIARSLGTEPFDAFVNVLRDEQLQVSMIVHSMQEEDLIVALHDSATMIGSDGLPPGVGGKPHPRMYGTFPRVLARFSRELGVLALPEAVRRMTALPADSFGIPDRGVIAPGKVADLVAIDAATVQDLATYTDPTHNPAGIRWVMINGRVVVREGRYLGPRAGSRLTPLS